MLVVGLTGSVGSGKSTVAKLIAARGVPLIDADVLARAAVEPGSPALTAIVRRWGRDTLGPDGSLNRAALGALVFGHAVELDALNGIVHPEVLRRRDELLAAARARGDRFVVCDIPLLYEVNMAGEMDTVIVVDAARETRLDRLITKRGFTRDVAEAIMATQLSSELKRELANHVIDNNGTIDALTKRVDDVWRLVETQGAHGSS